MIEQAASANMQLGAVNYYFKVSRLIRPSFKIDNAVTVESILILTFSKSKPVLNSPSFVKTLLSLTDLI
jgi:hypothetical protein